MNPEWRRYATWGLVVAIVAAIASVSLYIIQGEVTRELQISLGLLVIGLAAFAALDPDRVRELLAGRQARYGSNALVFSLAILGILLIANYWVINNPQSWDLTERKIRSLSDETLEVLEGLPEPVSVMGFFSLIDPSKNSSSIDDAQTLFEDYQYKSNGMFTFEFIDPDQNPVLTNLHDITFYGPVVVTMGDRQEKINFPSEDELTGAIIRLMSQEDVIVYFLTGHDEYSLTQSGAQAYTRAKAALERKNYTVKSLNLLVEGGIPVDANVIVIAGPKKQLSEAEVAMLADFVAGGGALVVMSEAPVKTDFGEEADPLAEYLTENWGIILGKDLIVDEFSDDLFIAYAGQYDPGHPITEKLSNLMTAYPTAHTLQLSEEPVTNVLATEIVFTGPQAWGETNPILWENPENIGNDEDSPSEEEDVMGPVTLVIAAEDLVTKGRVVVFGDAEFALDQYYNFFGNPDILINSIDWATSQEVLINITPKSDIPRIMLPPGRYTMGFLLFGSVFLIPGLTLVAGIVVYVLRRRRG